MNAARYWLGLASTLHAVIIAWAAHTLPWRPTAPLALLLWLLALTHAATAIATLANLASWRRVWRLQAFTSLAAALILIGSIALGAERLVVMFGRLGWNLTALLGVIAVLVLGLTVPMGLWGVAATRRHPERAPRTAPGEPEACAKPASTVAGARAQTLAGRPWAYLVGGGTLLAVFWPLCSGQDSFPLSNYPMFSRPRGQPVLFTLVSTDADGTQLNLPSTLIGSDEVLQTKALIQRAVSGGQASLERLCQEAAARVAAILIASQPGEAPAPKPSFIDIVSRRYDPVAYFVTGPTPLEEERLFRCEIPGVRRELGKRRGKAK